MKETLRLLRAVVSFCGRAASLGAIAVIRVYQATLSKIMPPVCRFQPT